MEITYKTTAFSELTTEEIDEFIDFCFKCHTHQEYNTNKTREHFLETITSYIERKNTYIIRAYDNSKLVGSIMLLDILYSTAVNKSTELLNYLEENNIDRNKSAVTTELWVDPDYFSNGIAKTLNQMVETLAAEKDFKHFVFFGAFEERTLRWYHAYYKNRITFTDIRILSNDVATVFLVDINLPE